MKITVSLPTWIVVMLHNKAKLKIMFLRNSSCCLGNTGGRPRTKLNPPVSAGFMVGLMTQNLIVSTVPLLESSEAWSHDVAQPKSAACAHHNCVLQSQGLQTVSWNQTSIFIYKHAPLATMCSDSKSHKTLGKKIVCIKHNNKHMSLLCKLENSQHSTYLSWVSEFTLGRYFMEFLSRFDWKSTVCRVFH